MFRPYAVFKKNHSYILLNSNWEVQHMTENITKELNLNYAELITRQFNIFLICPKLLKHS